MNWVLGIGHWALGIGHWALSLFLTSPVSCSLFPIPNSPLDHDC
ncbi:MAG: hypothetical protein V7K24_04995 [Nostoc sp.]